MNQKELEISLTNESVDTRLQAARKLSQLDRFVETLFLQALGDDDWRVRKEAISYFLQHPNAIARVGFIIAQLSHSDNAGLRNAAIEILISLGAQAAPVLLECLPQSDAEVRKFIIDILGEVNCQKCVPALLPYLRDDDENVRYAVVETLGKLGSVAAVGGLLDLLESADAGLQFTIFEALTSIGKGVPVSRVLPYVQNSLLRKSVFNCLGQLCDAAAIPVLLQGLSDPMRKSREVALLSLGHLIEYLPQKDCPEVGPQSDQILEYLYSCLQHEKQEYRRAACYALSLFPNADIVNQLLPLLAEEGLRVDVVAAAKLIPKVIFDELVETTELNDVNSLYLIFLLGELGYQEIKSLALQAIQSEDPQFRFAATITLGKISAIDAIPQLGDVLADEIPDLRDAASDALCEIGRVEPKMMIKTVAPYLESPESDLRLLAVKTIGKISTNVIEKHLLLALKDVAPEVRCEALRGLSGHQSPRLLSGLSLALTDEVADVRRLAAAALGAFPAQRSTSVLQHALDDTDPWVRMEAVRSLSVGDESQLLSILERGLADPVGLVVIAVLESVPKLLPNAADSLLVKALEHEDDEVAGTAVRLMCATDSCVDLLTHDRSVVRLLAVNELFRSEHPQGQFLLEERLASEPDAQVRQAIESALRKGVAGN